MKRQDYIKELEECLEDHSKIDEVLGRTNDLKDYLRGMGISEKYTESASVVEIIRNRLKSILLSEECEISETGIEHSGGEFKVNEDGSIDVSDEEGFKLPDENGSIVFYKDSKVIYQKILINNFGAIISNAENSKSPYAGEYYSAKRNDETNTIIIESSDGVTYEKIEEKPDNGNPITLSNLVDFETDYIRLVQEFPKIKQWYDLKYPGVNGNRNKFEEVRKNTEDTIEQKNIDMLKKQIDKEFKLIGIQDEISESATEKYQLMVDSISKIGKKSEIGKIVSNMLMKKVDKSILEKDDKKSQDREETEDTEDTPKDKKEERIILQKRLQSLRNLVGKKKEDNKKIQEAINRLEAQIKKIPVMGKNIIRKAKKDTKTSDREEK